MQPTGRSFRVFGALVVALLLLPVLPAGPVAAAPVVSTCNDSGAGSLRVAIAAAVAGDTITFSVNCPSGVGTQITLASTLTIAQNNLTIDATGHTIVVDGNNGYTVFTVTGGTSALPVRLIGLRIQGGNAGSGNGGGINNTGALTLTNVTVAGNKSNTGAGGGIANASPPSVLTVTNSTIIGNTAVNGNGGGIYNNGVATVTNSTFISNSGNPSGGGIYNAAGTTTVTGSTLTDNFASSGGGIYSAGTLTMTNSTVTANYASVSTGTASGGGIFAPSGTLKLTNSTITGNNAAFTGGTGTGGGIAVSGGTLTAINTLIAANSASGPGSSGPDVAGAFATGSKNNLLTNGSGATGIADNDANHNIVGHPAMLGTLGNYGGPTQTIPLLTGSPAIDKGDLATCVNMSGIAPVAALDQRGTARPQPAGGQCDIGAFEVVQAGPPPTPTNLRAISATTSEIYFVWTPPDNTSYIAVSDGSTVTSLAPGKADFIKSGIAPGGYACLSVAAWNAYGASAWSPWSCGLVVPGTPTNLHVSGATNAGVSFAWTDPDSASAIILAGSTASGTTYAGFAAGTTTGTKAVAAGQWACAQVAAYNASYASSYSPWACGLAVPNAPTNIHVANHTANSVSFAWTDSDPYSGIAVSNGSAVTAVPAGGTSYTQNGVASGSWACVSLAAYNSAGASPWTGWVCGQAG